MNRVEFEGCLARKLRFHIFDSWNSKDGSHESFVFTNHGCDLNGRISTKHCVFSGKWSFHCRAKLACLRDGCGRVAALAWKYSRTTCAMELMVPGDFFSSLMMLCFCLSHVLRCFVHWNCCIEEMRSLLELLELERCLARKLRSISFSHLQLLEFEGRLARKLCFHESRMRLERFRISTKHCVF